MSQFPPYNDTSPTTRVTSDTGKVTWSISQGCRPSRVTYDAGQNRCFFEFHQSPKLAALWHLFEQHQASGDFAAFAEANRAMHAMMRVARRDARQP